MGEETVQLRDKGVFTLPVGLRRKYRFNTGDVFSLVDLGEGAFALVPMVSRVDELADRVSEILKAEGVSFEDLLQTLEEERERCYSEHYTDAGKA
jgi:bifunctional DNA-binding transcriptional regulator/antitoxin component of YhaV-PrlF toxin-antitoxin module